MSTRTIPTWLAVAIVAIVAAVATVAVAAILGFMPDRGSDKLQDQPGYEEAHSEAEIYCTLGGVVPGMTSLYDPEYLACVKEQTKSNLESGDYE